MGNYYYLHVSSLTSHIDCYTRTVGKLVSALRDFAVIKKISKLNTCQYFVMMCGRTTHTYTPTHISHIHTLAMAVVHEVNESTSLGGYLI